MQSLFCTSSAKFSAALLHLTSAIKLKVHPFVCVRLVLCDSLLGVCGVRDISISGVWPLRLIIIDSSTTLMLLHCISSWSRLKISSAREHLNAKIPVKKQNKTSTMTTLLGCTKSSSSYLKETSAILQRWSVPFFSITERNLFCFWGLNNCIKVRFSAWGGNGHREVLYMDLFNFLIENVCSHMKVEPKRANIFWACFIMWVNFSLRGE